MTLKATVILSPPQEGRDSTLGEFTFAALPRDGDIIDVLVRTSNGASMTPYVVVAVRQHVAADEAPDVMIVVEE